ncbi:NlpC/P60 family protein [Sphingomonas montana]|uniref:C40 family peptidase n=1 Tax=Sphingomonas montana TaxID=1843236 RepID=UPI001F0A97A7|nr:NlpC/P60 family protein [Sphingomonas montana]
MPPRSVERFRLTGVSRAYDPRITAARRDIADIALADRVFAPHYVRPMPRICGDRATMLHTTPDAATAAVSQLLPGEPFAVLDIRGDWCWGYGALDQYLGHVRIDALRPVGDPATHIVTAPQTLLFARPDIKTPAPIALPIGSRIAGRADGAFLALTGGGFVPAGHVIPVTTQAADPVTVARSLVGMPYLWGGRGGGGIDCSGLVQLAHGLCGIPAPRDSDQQAAALGTALPADVPLQRGDLVFFPGHVGMMVDGDRMIHANAHWMAVVVEPLADVLARFPGDGGDAIVARRRPISRMTP